MARTRVWQLAAGLSRQAAGAIDAIVEVLIRLGQLAADHPEIRELDINPLLADADGVIALDARIRVAPAAQPGAARLAIAPYPQDLESSEQAARRDSASTCGRFVRRTSRCCTISLRI